MLETIKKQLPFYFAFFLLGASFASSLFFFADSDIKETDPAAAEVEKAEVEKITEYDLQNIETMTRMFLFDFREGNPLNEQKLTDLTFDSFSPQFLENDFSANKSSLFGLYGFEKLMNTSTNPEGLELQGAIQNFEITSLEKDNKNQTVTAYITMDTYELNTVHWIEWRNIPSHGWKINALSFHGNIESLENPLSPKKQL